MRVFSTILVLVLAFAGVAVGSAIVSKNHIPVVPLETSVQATSSAPMVPAPAEEAARIELSSTEIPQGETLVVKLHGSIDSLLMDGKQVPFSKADSSTIAVIGFDTRATVGPHTLTYQSVQGQGTSTFAVVRKNYAVTRIVVPPKLAAKGVTSGDLVASIAKSDSASLSDIVAVVSDRYHFTTAFLEPTDAWVDVGGFGTVREDENGSIRHLGVDIDGKVGDPVYATNAGIVVYAGELENFGKSIVIDHGLGIFSIYLHLSAISVSSGDTVVAREPIGSIGNTGAYTLAPHLHFSIKVHEISVDPRGFIDTFEKLFNADMRENPEL